jgi:hypothetical protein
METKTIIIGVVICVIVVGLALGLGLGLGLKKDSGSAAVPAATSDAAAGSTTTPAEFTLVAGTTSPSYGKTGYKPVPLENLPAKFTLKNTATGKFWGQSGDQVTDAAASATISAVSKSDIYSQTGSGTYTLTLNGDSTKSVRHSGFVMWYQNYTPRNFDFAWQLFLKDGTKDQVIVWNPYPGNNVGMHVKADGTRQKIDAGEPTVYTLAPVTSTSTYTPEPFSLF